MKTYQVELKYQGYVIYTVEAQSQDDAEDKAWEELQADNRPGYGEWEIESIEEITNKESFK